MIGHLDMLTEGILKKPESLLEITEGSLNTGKTQTNAGMSAPELELIATEIRWIVHIIKVVTNRGPDHLLDQRSQLLLEESLSAIMIGSKSTHHHQWPSSLT